MSRCPRTSSIYPHPSLAKCFLSPRSSQVLTLARDQKLEGLCSTTSDWTCFFTSYFDILHVDAFLRRFGSLEEPPRKCSWQPNSVQGQFCPLRRCRLRYRSGVGVGGVGVGGRMGCCSSKPSGQTPSGRGAFPAPLPPPMQDNVSHLEAAIQTLPAMLVSEYALRQFFFDLCSTLIVHIQIYLTFGYKSLVLFWRRFHR